MLRTKMVRSKTTLSLLAGSLLALGIGMSAEAAEALRIRGTVESFEGKVLTVKTREGETAKIALKEG